MSPAYEAWERNVHDPLNNRKAEFALCVLMLVLLILGVQP